MSAPEHFIIDVRVCAPARVCVAICMCARVLVRVCVCVFVGVCVVKNLLIAFWKTVLGDCQRSLIIDRR